MSQLFLERFEHRESGRATRQVICEKCSCRYQYAIGRTAKGHAYAFLGLGRCALRQRAQHNARRHLERRLATSADPVTCPHCGRLQADMVREIRRSRQGIFVSLATSILVAAVMILAMGLLRLRGSDDHSLAHWHLLLFWCGVPAAVSALVLIGRRLLSEQYDPAVWLRRETSAAS